MQTENEREQQMNSYLYDDGIQIEETDGFRLYETEQEYWEEYDRLKALKGDTANGKTQTSRLSRCSKRDNWQGAE